MQLAKCNVHDCTSGDDADHGMQCWGVPLRRQNVHLALLPEMSSADTVCT